MTMTVAMIQIHQHKIQSEPEKAFGEEKMCQKDSVTSVLLLIEIPSPTCKLFLFTPLMGLFLAGLTCQLLFS